MNHDYIDLQPVQHVQGTVRLPGSKSISNRILLLSALSQGDVQIVDLLASDDTAVMLAALRSLGVEWTEEQTATGTIHHVKGVALSLIHI